MFTTILVLFGHLLTVLGAILAVMLFSRIRDDSRHPGVTMAWLMGMVFIPYLAVPFYLLVGGRKIQRMAGRKESLAHALPPPAEGNRVKQLPGAVDSYQETMRLIEGAEESVWIMSFILSPDAVGRAIVRALANKAREGVEVRLLLDALGSFRTRGDFVDPIREAGGHVGVFMPMLSLQRKWSANLRNHRKIAIFDRKIAIVGGRNLGKEYMGEEASPAQWRDFSISVEGPAVRNLARIFAADWEFATDDSAASLLEGYARRPDEWRPGNVKVQTVASGPDVSDDLIYDQLLMTIFRAKRRIWIVTPYFVPDQTVFRTLMIMVRNGVSVRLVTPAKSNRRVVDLARRFFLRELSRAGADVCLYKEGMIHTKMLIIDDGILSVGSANMDMRSFYLNYEIALFLHSSEDVKAAEAYIQELADESDRYTGHEHRHGGMLIETLENLSRLFAPLL